MQRYIKFYENHNNSLKYYEELTYINMKSQNNIKNRILQWIDYNNLSVASFERKCGLSTGYIANMKPDVNSKKLNNIAIAFPNLNMDWLKTGEGEMINPDVSMVQTGNGGVHQQGHAGSILNQTANSEKLVTEFIDGLKAQSALTERSMDQTDRVIEELSEQRKLMDRLIKIIENK